MKNILLLEKYYSYEELECKTGVFVGYNNNHRDHESLNNVTPADVYYERDQKILKRREKIKKKTIQIRRKQNCVLRLAN